MDNIKKAYLQLHIAVFLWGFTAILGKLIVLNEVSLVWWRMGFTSISLLLVPQALQNAKAIPKKRILTFSVIGVLVAFHWITFYGSIKYSNVSVALSCLATTSLFTSVVEPIVFKKRVNAIEILLGIMVIAGFYLVFKVGQLYITGIIMGIISALLAAVFSTFNKKYIGDYNSRGITLIELSAGFIILSLIMPAYLHLNPQITMIPTNWDFFYLFVLALFCTTLPFILSLNALKHLSVFGSNLTINLEPVYGILLAILFFNENQDLNLEFYFGTLIILSAVFLHPFINRWAVKRK